MENTDKIGGSSERKSMSRSHDDVHCAKSTPRKRLEITRLFENQINSIRREANSPSRRRTSPGTNEVSHSYNNSSSNSTVTTKDSSCFDKTHCVDNVDFNGKEKIRIQGTHQDYKTETKTDNCSPEFVTISDDEFSDHEEGELEQTDEESRTLPEEEDTNPNIVNFSEQELRVQFNQTEKETERKVMLTYSDAVESTHGQWICSKVDRKRSNSERSDTEEECINYGKIRRSENNRSAFHSGSTFKKGLNEASSLSTHSFLEANEPQRSSEPTHDFESSTWPHKVSPLQVDQTSFEIFHRPPLDLQYKNLQTLHDPPKPDFNGFQLIGDSLLLRFANQILGEPIIRSEGLRFLGLCVSGQRVGELLKRLQSGFYHVGKKVVLLIGTNDILRNTSMGQMTGQLKKVIYLLRKKADRIVLLTLPPIPRLQEFEHHWTRLHSYNNFIKSLDHDVDGCVVISDIFPMYVRTVDEIVMDSIVQEFVSMQLFCRGCLVCTANDDRNTDDSDSDDDLDICSESGVVVEDICSPFVDRKTQKCRKECYESIYQESGKPDLIHLNLEGLQLVKRHLLEKFYKL